tara:strand:+ start:1990 stop:2124 length:135 start_codon:yes stop_codon:yes gene_type:complete
MKTVIVKISEEARKMLKIMSAQEGESSQQFLTHLVEEEFNKRNS